MATMKFEVVTGANTFTRTKTLSAADLQRMIAAYRIRFNDAALTDAQVADLFFEDLFATVRKVVRQTEAASLAEIAMT